MLPIESQVVCTSRQAARVPVAVHDGRRQPEHLHDGHGRVPLHRPPGAAQREAAAGVAGSRGVLRHMVIFFF